MVDCLFFRNMQQTCVGKIHGNVGVFQNQGANFFQGLLVLGVEKNGITLQPFQKIGLDIRIEIEKVHRFSDDWPGGVKRTFIVLKKILDSFGMFVGTVEKRDQRPRIKKSVLHQGDLLVFSCSLPNCQKLHFHIFQKILGLTQRHCLS